MGRPALIRSAADVFDSDDWITAHAANVSLADIPYPRGYGLEYTNDTLSANCISAAEGCDRPTPTYAFWKPPTHSSI